MAHSTVPCCQLGLVSSWCLLPICIYIDLRHDYEITNNRIIFMYHGANLSFPKNISKLALCLCHVTELLLLAMITIGLQVLVSKIICCVSSAEKTMIIATRTEYENIILLN